MMHYTITRDGRLVRNAWREGRHVPELEWPIHADVLFCEGIAPGEFVEYLARFTHGRVEWIRRAVASDERQDFVDDLDERLLWREPLAPVPALMGRRLTGDEFTANSPEKLELINGTIPGGEGLLRLLLTSLGLRRAALMVGHHLWKQALQVAESAEDA